MSVFGFWVRQFQPLVFWSSDVPKSYKELAAKGVEFLGPPKTEAWGTSAMFRDVDGNQFLLSSK